MMKNMHVGRLSAKTMGTLLFVGLISNECLGSDKVSNRKIGQQWRDTSERGDNSAFGELKRGYSASALPKYEQDVTSRRDSVGGLADLENMRQQGECVRPITWIPYMQNMYKQKPGQAKKVLERLVAEKITEKESKHFVKSNQSGQASHVSARNDDEKSNGFANVGGNPMPKELSQPVPEPVEDFSIPSANGSASEQSETVTPQEPVSYSYNGQVSGSSQSDDDNRPDIEQSEHRVVEPVTVVEQEPREQPQAAAEPAVQQGAAVDDDSEEQEYYAHNGGGAGGTGYRHEDFRFDHPDWAYEMDRVRAAANGQWNPIDHC